MRVSLQLALSLMLALFATVGQAQEKVTLVYKAQTGQVVRYKTEGSLSAEANGQKIIFEMKEIEKVTFTEVTANGTITQESETESTEVTVNGNKMPDQDDKSKSTKTFKADGTLVSYKSTAKDPQQAKMSARLYPASTVIFTDKPVGVGDKWTKEIKKDADLGTEDAKAEFEVVGFEKISGIDVVKIRMTYEETSTPTKVRSTGVVYVERSSGDAVGADLQVENMPLSGLNASAKLKGTRVEGAPLKSDVKPGAKPIEIKTEPKKDKTIDEVVKDYEKLPGQFTLYRKKESGRETIYLEVKEDQLNKLLMLQATAATGTSSQIVSGDPIDDLLFKFVKVEDDRLQMVVPNINFRVSNKPTVERSMKRSFSDSILEQYKIEARQPERKSLLINISDLFRGDISQISQQFSSSGMMMDREKTYIESIRNFPENLVVETFYNFTKGGSGRSLAELLSSSTPVLADPRGASVRVVYNFFQIPDNNYRPRLYDARVGYFTTDYQSFDRDDLNDSTVHYIYRWNLEKADPKAALSEPKKPIVFWLDNAIPLEYRDAVREGLLFWNKAFEKTGFKNAIVVKQMPDNADFETADMRYNVIRWVTSPAGGYAVALMRHNPVSGEILNASITVDSGIVRYTKLEREGIVEPASWFSPEDPKLRLLKLGHNGLINDMAVCDMAAQKMDQAWFGLKAMNLLGPQLSAVEEKEYTKAFIRDVVCHEMGHIMGLRHNFIASTYHSLDDLKNADLINRTGVTASVMDYTPYNISALKKHNVPFFMPTVGPYDIWAIQYGYSPIDAKTIEGERWKLNQIASKCNEPGLAYQSDEVADQFDPYVTRYDLGSDPLAYWSRNLQVTRHLMMHLGEREPKQGESYWEFTRDFYRLLNIYARSASVSSRFIGGLNLNRNFRGDSNEKPTLVPVKATDQNRALSLLNTYVFSENAFRFPKSYFTHLTTNPSAGLLESMLSVQDYPIRDTFASIQKGALSTIFRTDVLRRISNNEYKVGEKNALSLVTLFHETGQSIWAELDEAKNIDTLRRQLQRQHLDTLIGMVVNPSASVPDDAKMLAWNQLHSLKGRIAAARKRGSLDEYTRVHLDQAQITIDRALDAKMMINSGGGAPRTLTLQDLLGGQTVPGLH